MAASTDAAPWTPSDTTTAVWLDAADAGSVGSSVSQWNDKSGNNRHATQGNAANQGTVVSAAPNGSNVVRFDGNDFMNFGTGLDFLAGGGGNATHSTFAVLFNGNSYSNLYGAATASGSSDARLHVGFRNPSSYRINRWGNDSYPPITANYNAGEYNLLQWTWNEGGPKEVYANTLLEGSGVNSNTNGGTGTSLSPMSNGGRLLNVVGQGTMSADIAEFIIVHGTPTAEEVDLIEGYLAWKWWGENGTLADGVLPSDHPFRLAAPTVIPEPTSFVVGMGLLGLVGLKRRRR